MKVSELREKIKQRDQRELQDLLVEMYKLIPKAVKEEKEVDRLIDNPSDFKAGHKKVQATPQTIDFIALEKEVIQFLENAYAQNYIAPNRIVMKKERANWRFTAKRLVDQVTVLLNEPQYEVACIALLEKLYELFCYASGHYVFASEVPFETLKMSQVTFYETVARLKKKTELPYTWIRRMLVHMIDAGTDYNTSSSELREAFSSLLTDVPLKELAIQICKELMEEREQRIITRVSDKYVEQGKIESLTEMVFIIHSTLEEYEEAIAFYKKHYTDRREEVQLYRLLSLIKQHQQPQQWVNVYEEAVKEGVEPRSELRKVYRALK